MADKVTEKEKIFERKVCLVGKRSGQQAYTRNTFVTSYNLQYNIHKDVL
jgi:hypothetical protein